MNPLLNGTGWGELPAEEELSVPFWMTPQFQQTERRIREAEEAREAAAMAKARRKRRERAAIQQELRLGLIAWLTMAAIVFFVGVVIGA